MKINALKLRIATDRGEFGFFFKFSSRLTIIRAPNSSGKSTLFNSLLYSLGMEELIGGRGEQVLTYAVRDYFKFEDEDIPVIASETIIEIENNIGQAITLRRPIKQSERQSKLIEIFQGRCLTTTDVMVQPKSTYLHDAGGAQRNEGFHHNIEIFLGMSLPSVSTTSGGQAKLYLQTIFAALAVEQKRGWTDYIAGIPFYGIREVRTRVVEYLLALDVFEINARRSELDKESVDIHNEWLGVANELTNSAHEKGFSIENLATKPDALFVAENAKLITLYASNAITIEERISNLRTRYQELENSLRKGEQDTDEEILAKLEQTSERLNQLVYLHEQTLTGIALKRASNKEYEDLLKEIKDDLDRNKTIQKLINLGAKAEISIATNTCPTCHQPIEDSLLREVVAGPIMTIEENIAYLDKQRLMLEHQISGNQKSILDEESKSAILSREVLNQRQYVNTLRASISDSATESRSVVRQQLQIEIEVEGLQSLQTKTQSKLSRLEELARLQAKNQTARLGLPKEKYSNRDLEKIYLFQKMFRANAGSFGYTSAEIQNITIHKDTLTPTFQDIELREIAQDKAKAVDLTHNSSASDFVRLIWSYLLALFQTSSHQTIGGNHPGILLMDEPGQHSMRAESQHALLLELSANSELQSIIAASFEENKSVFEVATAGVNYQLIEWEEKLIRPL